MGVRFGAYEKTYSTDSVASISVAFVACVVSAFVMPFIITLVQPLFFKGSMSWTLIATITIGFFVGLATFSDAYNSGAVAIAFWLDSTLKAEWIP